MLPPRCSSPPCMNIDVNGVIQVGGCGSAWPATPRCPSHAMAWKLSTNSQLSPGWVSSYGIAP